MGRFRRLRNDNDDEYLKSERCTERICQRDDLNAFLILDRLLPGKQNIVSCAEHDIFYLDVDVERLEDVATDEDILNLIRCGVLYESETESLFMFV